MCTSRRSLRWWTCSLRALRYGLVLRLQLQLSVRDWSFGTDRVADSYLDLPLVASLKGMCLCLSAVADVVTKTTVQRSLNSGEPEV